MDYQGDSGGGFTAGGRSPNTSQTPNRGGSGGAPRKAYDEQTLIPVTCKIILAATTTSSQDGTGDLALPDGRPLHHVKLVGAVRSVENLSTNISYEIEDGTGLMEVKQWTNDNDSTAELEEKEIAARDAQYVRILGTVKDYDGKKTILAHSIRKLRQGDELTHHMLEVVYSSERHLRAERIGGMAPPVSMHHHNNMMTATTPIQQKAIIMGGGEDGLNESVINYIKVEGEKLEVGAPVHKLVQMLAGTYREAEVRSAIDYLASEGHIYSTINEDNYKFAM